MCLRFNLVRLTKIKTQIKLGTKASPNVVMLFFSLTRLKCMMICFFNGLSKVHVDQNTCLFIVVCHMIMILSLSHCYMYIYQWRECDVINDSYKSTVLCDHSECSGAQINIAPLHGDCLQCIIEVSNQNTILVYIYCNSIQQ